jgi:hypothetical protein
MTGIEPKKQTKNEAARIWLWKQEETAIIPDFQN